jgi:thiol-disulfide isomerase/thioredoxin
MRVILASLIALVFLAAACGQPSDRRSQVESDPERSAAQAEEAQADERRAFHSFGLETFDGDSLSLEDLRGKVALISFWASWCGPCRAELPVLDSLGSAIERDDFLVVGINEDVNEDAARAFAAMLGIDFPQLLGRGRMHQRYNYIGLPYSVLVDREGRVVYETYGFGGRAFFNREVVGRVMAELGRSAEHADD